MKLGIVGSEFAKFTPEGVVAAQRAIAHILSEPGATHVVSGHCHLGGVDIWAEEVGALLGLELMIFPPREHNWSAGYKPRNLQIASQSDKVYVIVPDTLPKGFTGMMFKKCYHCEKAGRDSTNHVKSGACWTALEALKLGKEAEWIIIQN